MLALDSRPDLIERTERITAATLAEQLAEPDPPLVLDVRAEDEVGERADRGERQHPARRGCSSISTSCRATAPIVVHCSSGYRSVDRREPAPAGPASSTSPTWSAGSAARSRCRQLDQLEHVFQLRCVPATPSPRSSQSSVSFVRPAPFAQAQIDLAARRR